MINKLLKLSLLCSCG